MSNSSNSPVFATVVEFKTAFAVALVKIAKAQALQRSSASDLMASLGLPRPVATDGNDYEIPEITESDMVDGKPRSAYKASWLAERDRKELHLEMKRAYRHIRDQAGYGGFTEDNVVQVCKELGLPTPEVKTTVEVRVKGVKPQTISFIVDGEVSDERVEEIKSAFASQAEDPMRAIALQLYANAEGLTDLVSVSRYPQRVWPFYPAFEERAEDSTTA